MKAAAEKPVAYSSLKRIIKMIVVALVIGLLVNILISFLVDLGSLGNAIGNIRWEHVVVPFAVYIVIYFIDALRLKMVLRQFNYRIGLIPAFVNSLMGYFFSNLTPMATGGQPFQIYHLKKSGIDAKTSTNVIVTRFIEYVGSAIILTLIFIPSILPVLKLMDVQTTLLLVGLCVSIVASVLIIFIFFRPDWIGGFLVRIEHSRLGRLITRIVKKTDWAKRAHAWSRELKRNIAFLWKEKLHIVLIDIVLCVVVLALQVFSLTWILIMFARASVNVIQVFVTVLLLNLVVYYIPTPGASGGLEGVYTMVFSLFTGRPEFAFIAVLVWRFATFHLQIFFGLGVFLVMRRRGLFSNRAAAPPALQEAVPTAERAPGPPA